MTVKELIKRLENMPQDANVQMCMDWDMLPEHERPSDQQWEDDLGDVCLASKKYVILLNKNFK